MEKHFPKISKNRTTSRGIAKIFRNFFPEFLECSVEWFAIKQFPENFCSICRCYANFRKFWFNGKWPRSTCSAVLLLPDIFHRNDPKSRVSNRIFQKHFVNGKQTRPLVTGMNRIHNPPSSRSDVLTTDLLDLHGSNLQTWSPQPKVSEIPWIFSDKYEISLAEWINNFTNFVIIMASIPP